MAAVEVGRVNVVVYLDGLYDPEDGSPIITGTTPSLAVEVELPDMGSDAETTALAAKYLEIALEKMRTAT
jgi:hypothetical protein